MKWILRFILVLVALSFVVFPVSQEAQAQFFFVMENPLVGEDAPEFEATTLEGKKVSFSEYRGEKNAIVIFWASWCPTCGGHMRRLTRDMDSLNKKKIKLILINMGESEAIAQAYLKKSKVNYETLLDKDEEIAIEYNVIALPTIFFIDDQGVVKAVENSLPKRYQDILEQKVQEVKKG